MGLHIQIRIGSKMVLRPTFKNIRSSCSENILDKDNFIGGKIHLLVGVTVYTRGSQERGTSLEHFILHGTEITGDRYTHSGNDVWTFRLDQDTGRTEGRKQRSKQDN